MPSGLNSYEKHTTVISARRSASSDGEQIKYFGIDDGQTARIRFLEQGEDLTYALTHRIRNSFGGYSDIVCLDQEDEGVSCPACQSDSKDIRIRGTKGFFNVIWRGTDESPYVRGPVYKVNDKGWFEKDPNTKKKIIVGFEDSVFLWKSSKTIWEMVLGKEKTFKGIMSRDFVVSRQGATKDNTKYAIEPAVIDGGPEPMTVADTNIAKGKFNVVQLTTPGTYDEMVALLNEQQTGGGSSGNTPRQNSPAGIVPDQSDIFNGQAPMRSSAFSKQ